MATEKRLRNKAIAAGLAVILLLMLGTAMYSALEDWSVIDAAYFTAVTMTTIGYGDIAPTHAVSKLFTIFFIFMGVGVFLFSVTVIAEHYFGRRITTLEKTVDKVSQQAREAIIRMGTPEPQTGRSYMKQVVMEHNKPRKPLQQKQETKK